MVGRIGTTNINAVGRAAGALGAYVDRIALADVTTSADLVREIRELLVEHQVLFFRDQQMTPAEYQTFASAFGEFDSHGAYPTVAGADHVQILESTPDNPSKIEMWHSDTTFKARPPHFTFLHSQIVPGVGGDTLWASACAAWDGLSAPMRQMLDGLEAEHDFRHGFRESLAEPGGEERLADVIAEHPPVTHPLVRTHPESGRKAIFVNGLFTTRILGLSPLESSELLTFLCAHVASEEYTVRLSWQPQTLAVWDNRSTQHKPVNDFHPAHRLMHRLTIAGDRPV